VARRFLLREKCTASGQLNTEHGEIVRCDDCTKRAARIALLAKSDERDIETHHVTQDRILIADIEVRWIRKTAELFRILLVLRKKLHHFVWLGVSRGSKEKSVHHTEHSGIHPNPQREHSRRCNRKRRRLQQLPKRKLEIPDYVQANEKRFDRPLDSKVFSFREFLLQRPCQGRK